LRFADPGLRPAPARLPPWPLAILIYLDKNQAYVAMSHRYFWCKFKPRIFGGPQGMRHRFIDDPTRGVHNPRHRLGGHELPESMALPVSIDRGRAPSCKSGAIAAARFLLVLLLAGPAHRAGGETIQLERQHGTYVIPVQINGTLVLPFVLDTGASSVVLPADVFRTLARTGTVTRSDFIGTGTAMLADGSRHASDNYVLHEMRVGDHIVRNVVASVVSVNGDPLLGQTFLSQLPAWAIDNSRQVLVIGDGAGPTQSLPTAPTTPPASGFGAIAWDPDNGRYGASWNHDTAQRADEVALSSCGSSGCKIIIRTLAAMCAALATTVDGKYAGGASRRDRNDARLAALANCQKGNAGACTVRVTDCNR
jgi:clan AA aspartic protease (TIGR02281 family)